MSPEEFYNRISEALRTCEEGSELADVLAKWDKHEFVVRRNGVWRLEGFINFFQKLHEIMCVVDPTIDPALPPQCFDARSIARFFRLPPDAFDHQLRGPLGTPGRKATTADVAQFALRGRQQKMTWKEIAQAWKREHPADRRVKNWESIREAYRRCYGDKTRRVRWLKIVDDPTS